MADFFGMLFLKRRAICRVAGIFALLGGLLLLVANTIATGLELPPWVAHAFVLLLVVIGVPIFIIAVWVAGPSTPEEALEWYRFQAERGDTYAQNVLREIAEREATGKEEDSAP